MQIHINYGSDFKDIAYIDNGNQIKFDIESRFQGIFDKDEIIYVTHQASARAFAYQILESKAKAAEPRQVRGKNTKFYLYTLTCLKLT